VNFALIGQNPISIPISGKFVYAVTAAEVIILGEFVYAVTAAEGVILSLFTSNEQ